MLRPRELPLLDIDIECDPSDELIVERARPSVTDTESDGIGLRRLIERPSALRSSLSKELSYALFA